MTAKNTSDLVSRVAFRSRNRHDAHLRMRPRARLQGIHRSCIDPESVGTAGLAAPSSNKLDLRPGGELRFCAHTPDGTEYGFHGSSGRSTPERFTWTFDSRECRAMCWSKR